MAPLLLIAIAVLLPAAVAGVVRELTRIALLLSLPLAISVVLVNVFFFPGGEMILLRIGPIVATAEGLRFALEILLRLAAISGAIVLFYLTTRPGDLVIDLEARGVSPRLTFVANASVQTVPSMVDRAVDIAAAQRARGLDSEGSPWSRVRGLLPLVAPAVLGSIAEVEERHLSLCRRGASIPACSEPDARRGGGGGHRGGIGGWQVHPLPGGCRARAAHRGRDALRTRPARRPRRRPAGHARARRAGRHLFRQPRHAALAGDRHGVRGGRVRPDEPGAAAVRGHRPHRRSPRRPRHRRARRA